jgi:subtilisin family serine protease
MRFGRKPGLVLACLMAMLWFAPHVQAQSPAIELNVKVLAGTSAHTYLRTREGTVPAALLRDTHQAPAMQGCLHVQALANAKSKGTSKALEDIFTLQFEAQDIQGRIAQLMGSGQFAWVEENRMRPLDLPLDNSQDARVGEQWYHARIQTFQAWDSTRGNPDVVVGVIDTGIDFGHPEFDGQIAVNPLEDINGNGKFEPWPDTVQVAGLSGDFDNIDQDNNGYADDVIGYDFTDQPRSPFGGDYLFQDPNPDDENNHGTLVSGIIVAKADNNYGGTGIAPGCRVKVLRAFSANGSGEDDDIARAIVYAADNGIRILNFSFGDIYPSQTMHAAIQYAYSKGVVMVGSSGNGTGDNLHYPSSFDEVISVGATALNFDESSEVLWPLSSFGHTLSLVAPGSGILCPTIRDTLPETDDFDVFSGTSTSAPMVSAAVALLFSQRGACSPQQIRGILTSTTDDIGEEGWDHLTGAGRLNLLKALRSAGASNVQILHPSNDFGTSSDSLWIIASTLDPQGLNTFLEYQSGISGEGNWIPIESNIENQVLADTLAMWDLSGLADGEYTLRLRLEKSNGTTAEDRVRVVLDRSAPVIDLRHAVLAWDNEVRKFLVVFRNSDRGQTSLAYRPLGSTTWQRLAHDRNTRNGSLMLGPDRLAPGSYEFQLECINEAGLSSVSPMDTLVYAPDFVPIHGYAGTGLSLPMGHYLQDVQDFDQDGLPEVVMSQYDGQLNFGRLASYEYNAVGFTVIDSIAFKPILIPKDIQDADSDGLLDLLCSVNDSIYVLEQLSSGLFPANSTYSNLNNGLYAAKFADTDDDTVLEILAKDQKDYKILEPNSGSYTLGATLADQSGGFVGSVAPRVLTADFDGDGNTEMLFGDFDGDLSLYEHNGNGYSLRWVDSTKLTQSGGYICQGDFDGDGKPEIFSAAHSPLNRNEEDFEYEAPYWRLRIFESNANDTYQQVWEDFLFDIDTEEYNAATTANLDLDAADELIFTTFPRTYILDWDGSDYKMDWFHFGGLCTHHVAHDFDGNGIQEFALGRGDTAFFFEKEANYAGPEPVAHLEGYVVDGNTASLQWSASANATEYRIWRGDYNGPGTVQISLVDSTVSTQAMDSGLLPGQAYLYVVEAENLALSPQQSPFSYAILLQPHAPGKIDSVSVSTPTLLTVHFSVAVAGDEQTHGYFRLDSAVVPLAAISGAGPNTTLLLSLSKALSPGLHMLTVDSSFLDANLGRLDPTGLSATFSYQPDESKYAYFSAWEIADPSTALIHFNLPMQTDVLATSLWTVQPFGRVAEVEFAPNDPSTLRVHLEECVLGALGYPVSITLHGGTAADGSPMREKEGNTATFSEYKTDLSQVYVYPNPYRENDLLQGIRFANLTRQATVTVIGVSGEKVVVLEETDGDGGLDWNLVDVWGKRIRPGVYLYQVESEGIASFVGKFSILE